MTWNPFARWTIVSITRIEDSPGDSESWNARYQAVVRRGTVERLYRGETLYGQFIGWLDGQGRKPGMLLNHHLTRAAHFLFGRYPKAGP